MSRVMVRHAEGGRLSISAISFGARGRRVRKGVAGAIKPIEAFIGGELGVEDQVLRHAAALALPECDEAKDLLGLVALADVGIGVAEDLAVGVLGQEGENAGLAAAALGQIVRFDERMLAEVGHGMEVEVERLAR